MIFYGFTKGKDDFGREMLNNQLAKFTLIGVNPNIGDIVLFLYPELKGAGLYTVTKRYPCPWNKPGEIGIYEGECALYPKGNKMSSAQQWIEDFEHTQPEIVKQVIDYVENNF